MIVYGDLTRTVRASDLEVEAHELYTSLARAHLPEARRQLATKLLLTCGGLAQGLCDAAWQTGERDELTQETRASAKLLRTAGALFVASLERRASPLPLRALEAALAELEASRRTHSLTLKEPEGFAHYAVCPELYVSAAQQVRARSPAWRVIGLRSIGTTLAAVVAGALPGTPVPWTLRPTGHPFARRVEVGPLLEAELVALDAHYAIVDEGPGLSGSSLLCVAQWLRLRGVPCERIVLFPSHAGTPGPMCPAEDQSLFRRLPRAHQSFEETFLRARQSRGPELSRWFEDVIGPSATPRDLSGGLWRAEHFASEAQYPASHLLQERRKYALETRSGEWLVKWTGLGARGETAQRRSQILAHAGLANELLQVRRGFGLERWHASAKPLTCSSHDRPALLSSVARYVAFVARHFRNAELPGARPTQLHEMAACNIRELLGPDHATLFSARVLPLLGCLHEKHVPTATDNKLDAHEWLVAPDGRVFKTDALEHHAGHDLIGCQDPAWDVMGAVVELDLSESEQEAFFGLLFDRGLRPCPLQCSFYLLTYLAFRAGQAKLASVTLQGTYPQEAARLDAACVRYLARLRHQLELFTPSAARSSSRTDSTSSASRSWVGSHT